MSGLGLAEQAPSLQAAHLTLAVLEPLEELLLAFLVEGVGVVPEGCLGGALPGPHAALPVLLGGQALGLREDWIHVGAGAWASIGARASGLGGAASKDAEGREDGETQGGWRGHAVDSSAVWGVLQRVAPCGPARRGCTG
jgi:hypothetical protein